MAVYDFSRDDLFTRTRGRCVIDIDEVVIIVFIDRVRWNGRLLHILIATTILNVYDSIAEREPELVIVRLFLELLGYYALLLRISWRLRGPTALIRGGAARVSGALLLLLRLIVAEKEVKLHVVGEAYSSVALFDERRVQADRLTDLLLHEVVPVAPYLEIVLHFGTHRDNSLADKHLGQAGRRIYL